VEIKGQNRFSRESSLFLYVRVDELFASNTPGARLRGPRPKPTLIEECTSNPAGIAPRTQEAGRASA
jgi:hypothetical protein